MAIRQELLEELLKDYKSPEDLLGQGGLLKELTKALVEKALDGELTHHLGYPKVSSVNYIYRLTTIRIPFSWLNGRSL